MKQNKSRNQFLIHQKDKIKQQKKRDTFPRHQKAEMKQQKTKKTFLRHATGKVQQPRTTKRFRIKKMEKKRIQGEQLSLKQTSTTEDHTKISEIEDRKETAQVKIISQARFHNRRQNTDYQERRSKRNSTRPSM